MNSLRSRVERALERAQRDATKKELEALERLRKNK